MFQMEVVDADTLSGMLSTEWLSAFHVKISVLSRLDVQWRGPCGFQHRVSKAVDNTEQIASKRGSQMSFLHSRKGFCLSSRLVNPRAGGILRYTSVISCGHNFSEIQASLTCHIDWTPCLNFSRSSKCLCFASVGLSQV